MKNRIPTVAQFRKYAVTNVEQARDIAWAWLKNMNLENVVSFGLPEIDDRFHIWRVPLMNISGGERLGEAVIDAQSSLVIEEKSTRQETLEARLLGRVQRKTLKVITSKNKTIVSALRNIVACGDSEEILQDLPAQSIDLVFTSPPYFNARLEYNDYITYEEYLLKMRKVIHNVNRVLNEGRFFIMNISPVLIRRENRTKSSKRVAVPFDMHQIFVEEGFDFIDDIIWVKPEGAGWATGRGRRFAADRNPLQYKPVPVTEYILVYRKHTDKLIDWHIRNNPNPEIVKKSRVSEDYERTNIWYIKPTYHPVHPAVFPLELAEKVISYYSFKNDVVMDPFAGIGTVGKAATKLQRRFVLIENNPRYVEIICNDVMSWLGNEAEDVLFINCAQSQTTRALL